MLRNHHFALCSNWLNIAVWAEHPSWAIAWLALLQCLRVEKARGTCPFSPSGLAECMPNSGHWPGRYVMDIRLHASWIKDTTVWRACCKHHLIFLLLGQNCRLQTYLFEELTSTSAEAAFTYSYLHDYWSVLDHMEVTECLMLLEDCCWSIFGLLMTQDLSLTSFCWSVEWKNIIKTYSN